MLPSTCITTSRGSVQAYLFYITSHLLFDSLLFGEHVVTP